MEFLPFLRLIWRRRLLAGAGLVVALVTFFALGGAKLTSSTSAVAWTRVALDTPKSQLVDAAAPGGDTLPWRAGLVRDLMTTATATNWLAGRLGVPPNEVLVSNSDAARPLVSTALAQSASTAASSNVAPYTLTVFIANDSVPVITLVAAAPTSARAQQLAQAAVGVIQSEASSAGTFSSPVATNGKILSRQAFVVEQAAPVREKPVSTSGPSVKALGAALLVFVLWCASGTLGTRLSRGTRGGRAAVAA